MASAHDLRDAEATPRADEENFRLVLDCIPGLVNVLNAAGEMEFGNQQLLNYFGKTFEELKGWASTDVIHPDDLPKVIAAWRHSVETGEVFDLEHRLRRADGMYRWFHGRILPLRNKEGRIIRWYSLVTDIHELKQAEEKLRRGEWKLLEAQRLGHSGSWNLDLATGIVSSSPEMVRVFRAEAGEDHSAPDFWFNRIHPEDQKRVREQFEDCVARKINYEAEYRLLLPDGTIRHQKPIGQPVLNKLTRRGRTREMLQVPRPRQVDLADLREFHPENPLFAALQHLRRCLFVGLFHSPFLLQLPFLYNQELPNSRGSFRCDFFR